MSDLGQLSAAERIEWALEHLPGAHIASSSFGSQSAVMLHLVTQCDPNLPVVVIDTGYLFPETYQFIDRLANDLKLNLEVVKQMEMLAPFGAGNPRPVLYCGGVELDQPARRMGGGDRHLTVQLRQGSKIVRSVAFGAGQWCDQLNATEGPIEIAYRAVINEYRGFRKVEIHLVDWRPAITMATV